jgi:transposase
VSALKEEAQKQIEETSEQKSLFPKEKQKTSPILVINKSQYLGVRYTFIYDALSQILRLFQFDRLNSQLLLDLVIMRIIQPVSKLESLEYLSEMFGITYKRGHLYEAIATFAALKNIAEQKILAYAQQNLSFDFSIVFYDVTTLYFESFTSDEDTTDEEGVITKGLRKPGFSKDNKANQPQIVIGLIVTKEGFPVAYDIFAGNTFEGKTFIPTITTFRNAHAVKTLTVVADAAMISFENVQELIKNNLSYIVGARMANLKPEQIKQISKDLTNQSEDLVELTKRDSSSMRIETERGLLVCDFSLKRYRKDKREMEKQIAKAERLLEKNEGTKRTKFLKNKDDKKTEQIINTDLIKKTKLLLGIKGYYTNLTDEANETIIKQYHSLWHVEKAFRIAKSDLQARPIVHHKKQTIETHILICFMALAVCKYMELKTGISTKKIVKQLRSITEARIKNKLTGEIIVMKQELPEEIDQLWKTLTQ